MGTDTAPIITPRHTCERCPLTWWSR